MQGAPTAIVLTGGEGSVAPRPGELPNADLVIAADSGLALAADLGLHVDLVVGDMDSVDPAVLSAAVEQGAAVERHPADKDATDLELALQAALTRGATRIVVAGGTGGRLDHLLGNAFLLAADALANVEVEWWAGPHRVVITRDHARIDGSPGDPVSLLPFGGPAHGITTTGLRWRLAGETLQPGSTRGISNEMTGTAAEITLTGGMLFVVHRRSEP